MIEQELQDVHGILSEINGLLERDGSISIRSSVCPSVKIVGLSSILSSIRGAIGAHGELTIISD